LLYRFCKHIVIKHLVKVSDGVIQFHYSTCCNMDDVLNLILFILDYDRNFQVSFIE